MGNYIKQQIEAINRNTVISIALAQGFNAFIPAYDGGFDFILYRESDQCFRKVQLKGRWTIDRKYLDREIWIAFPHEKNWYLAPHDEMVEHAHEAGITNTISWERGTYSKPTLSKVLIEKLHLYRLEDIANVASEASSEAQLGPSA